MYDYAIVGSGIGGSSIAAYLNKKGFSVILFEKESYLGGCSSTFCHRGFFYNTGATTFAGYQQGNIVKSLFDEIEFTQNLIRSDPAIVVIQNNKITPRYQNFEHFLEILNQNYPHSKNREFWELIFKINQQFYQINNYYYSGKHIFKKTISLLSYTPIFLKFQRYLRENAESFIKKFFGSIDKEYYQFMQSQILIVAQAPSKEINFLTAALALGYTFQDTYIPQGGFSKLFDGLTSSISQIKKIAP